MFNKLKKKAAQPLTYGWLWKWRIADFITVGIIYGGMLAYKRYLEKKFEADAETKMDYNKFENEED